MFINGGRRNRGDDDGMIKLKAYIKIAQKAYIHDNATQSEKENLIERMKDYIWNTLKTIKRENLNPVIEMKRLS